MTTTVSMTRQSYAWDITPASPVVSAVLAVLFLYLFVRHFLFVLMVFDIVLGWLRRFRWFPGAGRRRGTALHWCLAVGLFAGFLTLAISAGWVGVVRR